MSSSDSSDRTTPPAGTGSVGDASVADLSAPAGTEDGSLAALLGDIARAPAADPPFELAPDDELGGVYRIVRRIGSGGMGVVYLARDLELQRDVAVKVHRAAVGTERLYREAVAMAQLSHPNVVTIHAVGRARGRLYIAMELVPGDNLSGWLGAAPRSWREILDVMLEAGEGLAAAHDAGFVHRDIKPHNILVGHDRRPRVSDFGLVRVSGDGGRADVGEDETEAIEVTQPRPPTHDSTASTPSEPSGPSGPSRPSSPLADDLTALGTTLGTPAYMAPEQLAGREVDARADQFGFCVVLYEALYGRRPWTGKTVAALRKHLAATEPRAPSGVGVPAWLWPVLRRGLSADPADRYPDVRALLDALRAPPRRGLVATLAVLGGVGAVAAVIAIVSAYGGSSDDPACDTAGAPVIAAWGPAVRLRISAQYARVDPLRGPAAADALAAAIDAWSLRWQRAAVTACQASHRSWTPAIAAASDRCLDASLTQLRGLVAQAESGDALVADVASLRDAAECADPPHLVGGAPTTGAAIEGYWTGDFGHLLLKRVGDEVLGVYEHDTGTIRGTIVGDHLTGWWCEAPSRQPPGDAGDLEMRVIVDSDGVRSIAGQWRYGTAGDWNDRWDLTADPGEPPADLRARLNAVGDFCARPAR
ncbi:MAG: serine/threonine protein kinase [Deltaproteobacteria bacterium]|nr:serine/threonine protein kinase [Deltaproteobacteria bacterium]